MSRSASQAGSGRHPAPLHLVSRLREVMQAYRGSAHTVRARDLTVVLGIKDPTGRTIRVLVNTLIDEGVPIGSVNLEAGGGGYFVVTNEVELARCLRALRSRAREILKRAERLEEAFRHGPRQPALLP